jgi:oligogalacturonide transporter
MFRDLWSTLRIRAFRQHLSLYLGGYLSQDIFNTAFPIFVATVLMGTLGATMAISQLMTTMYLAQLVSVMVAIRVVIKVGPVFAYRAAITLFIGAALLYGMLYLRQQGGGVDAPSALWLFGPIILAGLGRGTLNFVPWSVYNYLPDIDEAVTGQRREGIFAGVMTLVRKLTQSIAIVATGWIIDAGGYISPKTRPGGEVVQTDGAILTVTLVMVVGPVLVMLLGLWAAWNFRLNASTHRVLVNEVDRLRKGATEAESPESRRIVEDLTGWQYGKLWGRGGKRDR